MLSLVTVRPVAAEPAPFANRRIRSLEARLQALVERGMHSSPTFRRLAARVERSDVIVYLLSGLCLPPRVDGRLTFLSAAGGVRYVVVHLRPLASPLGEVAVLAHELQHAVEIAERPAIVDERSLAREYLQFGHTSRLMPRGTAFDTRAAIDVGVQVGREVRGIAIEGVAASR